MPFSPRACTTFVLAAGLLFGGMRTPLLAQPRGEYVGSLGIFNIPLMPAVLTIKNPGGRFTATLTFVTFKGPIGSEKLTYTAELEGRYEQKFRRVQMVFKRWIGDAPDRTYALAPMSGEFDEASGAITAGGLMLGARGTPMASKLEAQQARRDENELRQREREEARMARTGQLERERERMAARDRERAVAANPAGVAARRGLLDAASNPAAQCAVLEKWAGQLQQEYPVRMRALNFQQIEMQANLFRDEWFVPVFGRAYDDDTTEAWRLGLYNERMRGCVSVNGIVGPAFGFEGSPWPPQLFAAIQKRRLLRQELTAIVNGPAVNSFEGFTAVSASLTGLTAFSALWPSEIEAARSALQARRSAIAGAIAPPWQRELLSLPVSLENATRIADGLVRWRDVIQALEPAAQSATTAPIHEKLDADLAALIRPSMMSLLDLTPNAQGLAGWSAWQATFARTFARFDRPPVKSAFSASAGTRRRLLAAHLPAWREEIARLPPAPDWLPTAWQRLHVLFNDGAIRQEPVYQEYRAAVSAVLASTYAAWADAITRLPPSTAGLAQARAAVASLFGVETQSLPEYARYKAASDRFVAGVLERVPALADSHPSAPLEAKQWFRTLSDARRAKSADVLTAVKRVRLTLAFDDDSTQAATSTAGLRAAASQSLAAIGLAVDPTAVAELVVSVGSTGGRVTTTYGVQREASMVRSVWASVSLRAPVVVPRTNGYHRVRATLASTIAGVSLSADASPVKAMHDVIDEAIDTIAPDIDSRLADPADDAAWREDLLSSIPGLERGHAAYLATVAHTDNGQRPSLAGITATAPLRYGLSPHNRAGGLDIANVVGRWLSIGSAFEPKEAWAGASGALPWPSAHAGIRTPVPVHYFSAMPLGVHEVTWPDPQGTTLWLSMQQIALLEPNCVLTGATGSFRLACLTAEAFHATAGVRPAGRNEYSAAVEKLMHVIRAARP